MIPVTKDTLLIVATIVCAVALVFLFKELNKTKKDIDGFKNFSAQVVRHLSAPPEEPSVSETEEETKKSDVKEDE
jgi:hypothetical protein|tara:strand:- start:19618 stop:19842 length:225 start_codon:yes stop_codon:yes gene_type:complete